MASIRLVKRERLALQSIILRTTPARALSRAQALLWLAEGKSPEEVADVLNITRQTVYNWIRRFEREDFADIASRILDSPRSGRPPTAKGIIDPIIAEVIDRDPRQYGYHYTNWTASLLQIYLAQEHGIKVSRYSVSRAIDRLELRWKRPRYVLALKSETYRQSKGG